MRIPGPAFTPFTLISVKKPDVFVLLMLKFESLNYLETSRNLDIDS